MPNIKLPISKTRKIKNIVFAIDAAPAAIPENPKKAAIIAITRKIAVHLNITFRFWFEKITAESVPFLNIAQYHVKTAIKIE